jgi:hypothetical protein
MQNFENHARVDPVFHRILVPLLLLTFIGACVNFGKSLGDHERLYSASLILVLSLCLILTTFLARIFPLRAQDRAIRAEESLRHYVLTGKLLDPRLTVRQVVALRFASDGEFVALAAHAVEKSLPPKEIKKAIKNWRADDYRV